MVGNVFKCVENHGVRDRVVWGSVGLRGLSWSRVRLLWLRIAWPDETAGSDQGYDQIRVKNWVPEVYSMCV